LGQMHSAPHFEMSQPDPYALWRRLLVEVDTGMILPTAVNDCGLKDPSTFRWALSAFFQWFSVLPTLQACDPPYVMNKGPVDLVWHAFILNTEAYRALCSRYLGRFLDHYPRPGSPPVAWIVFTVDRLRTCFGPELNWYIRRWDGDDARTGVVSDTGSYSRQRWYVAKAVGVMGPGRGA
jgi:hypothetical protein